MDGGELGSRRQMPGVGRKTEEADAAVCTRAVVPVRALEYHERGLAMHRCIVVHWN
jgi:hypothetical protein